MYRIVREENRLTGRVQYIIERKRNFLWIESWSRDLGLDIEQNGPVGAPNYDGAKWKMEEIMAWDGKMIKRETV